MTERAVRSASLGGAVLAAIAASSCCIGPLVVAALGVGGAGAFATIAAYRPHILVGTVVLLGVGYYVTYRKVDACGCTKRGRAGKVGLWLATGMVILFAAVPSVLARLARSDAAVAAPGVAVVTAVIHVQGIDCEGCASGLRAAMSGVGGFHGLELDIPHQTVVVTYEPAPMRLEAYAKAIEAKTGFEVTLPPTHEGSH
jgi:copper chaperone CopZ